MTAAPAVSARPLVLASQSPRRIELMQAAGYSVEVLSPSVEEAHDKTLSPEALTVANATLKAQAGATLRPQALVIGADTLVYVDGIPLGKPKDMTEAAAMLHRLSGRTHQVCTGVCLASEGGAAVHGFHVITEVTFRALSAEAIQSYHSRVNPLDKAGGYGIQEQGDLILEAYSGSWTNVMGLPMEALVAALSQAGIPCPQSAQAYRVINS